jgi:hypothetical protein
VGRHLAREEEPPPRDKPRYRFVVAISGIVMLAFVAMVVVNLIFPEQSPQAAAGPEEPGAGGNPFPAVPGDPGLTPPPTDPALGATTPPATTTPTPPSTTTATTNPPTQPSGPVAGAYSAEEPYPGGDFQAQVRLTNSSGTAQPWQIRLRYPANVTGVVAIWIDSYPNQPQPPGTDQGAFVFTGSAPLGAGETIVVRFHMNASGEDIGPNECSVNGRACS